MHKTANNYFTSVASICYLSDYYQSNYPLESVAEDLGEEQFKFIVYDYCDNIQNIPDWKQFFLKINIIKPNGLEIIRRLIVPMIESESINLNNTVKITRFIFSVLHNKIISDNELKSNLNNLLLQTNNGLKIATDCYLSEFYSPTSQDKDFLKEVNLPNLVSADYCINNESPEVWRQFFINIGVLEIKGIELIRRKI